MPNRFGITRSRDVHGSGMVIAQTPLETVFRIFKMGFIRLDMESSCVLCYRGAVVRVSRGQIT